MTEVARLRGEVQSLQTTLNDVTAQKERLQYEVDAIYAKNGTYRIVWYDRASVVSHRHRLSSVLC